MDLHGTFPQRQRASDLLVRKSFDKKSQNLTLPWAQIGTRGCGFLNRRPPAFATPGVAQRLSRTTHSKPYGTRICEERGNKNIAGNYDLQRADQLDRPKPLWDIAVNPGFKGGEDIVAVLRCGYDGYSNVWMKLTDGA